MFGANYNLSFNTLENAWLDNSLNRTEAGEGKMQVSGAPNSDDNRFSYFGRVHYNFRETYLLNATFRADGSSRFASGHRWGYFPSVSAGWLLTNETFMSALTNVFDQLKLRASWGQVTFRHSHTSLESTSRTPRALSRAARIEAAIEAGSSRS